MDNYKLLMFWALVAVIVLIVVKRIVKKTVFLVLAISVLVGAGCIPISTVQSVVDMVNGGYEKTAKSAALWRIETKYDDDKMNNEKTLYILNMIPIELN